MNTVSFFSSSVWNPKKHHNENRNHDKAAAGIADCYISLAVFANRINPFLVEFTLLIYCMG